MGAWLGNERIHLEETDSTSDELWRRARAGLAHGGVLSADRQTSGRGRQGRTWTGGEGNLFVSWLLRFEPPPPESLSALSIVQGLALAGALDARVPGRISLKWPNDLLLDGMKVGGLLLETRSGKAVEVVSGLGLNLVAPPDGWGELDGLATSIEEATGARVTAGEAIGSLLPELERAIDLFVAAGPGPALEEWSRWSALDGREIEWEDQGTTASGCVLGVAADGGLRVATPGGSTTVLLAGDVHLTEAR